MVEAKLILERDIEVEAEIEERDPVVCRPDEISGYYLSYYTIIMLGNPPCPMMYLIFKEIFKQRI